MMPTIHRALLAACIALCVPAQAQTGEEVPFITSPDNVTLEMLRLAAVGPRDHVVDLGSGDGRIVILAARRFGASGLGVEIDPALVRLSRQHAREAGVAGRVDFREQDLFRTELGDATVVTMYLLPEVNLQLRPRLLALRPGTRVVSHDWDMGNWKPDRTTVVAVPDKKVGLDKSSKVHLWVVPARVDGLWCGRQAGGRATLDLRQAYQEVEGRLTRGDRVLRASGRLVGEQLQLRAAGERALVLQKVGETLTSAGAVLFTRARAGRCG
jgi:SAM-dependent methyltransferase